MHGFQYDYVKPKYFEKEILCCMDTDSFIVHKKADDISKDIAQDVETRLHTSKHELNKQNITKRKK